MSSSVPVNTGVGDGSSIWAKNGTLWGSGEISIRSFNGPGEDEGSGGVVTHSTQGQLPLKRRNAPRSYLCHASY